MCPMLPVICALFHNSIPCQIVAKCFEQLAPLNVLPATCNIEARFVRFLFRILCMRQNTREARWSSLLMLKKCQSAQHKSICCVHSLLICVHCNPKLFLKCVLIMDKSCRNARLANQEPLALRSPTPSLPATLTSSVSTSVASNHLQHK